MKRRWRDDPINDMHPWWRAPITALVLVGVPFIPAIWYLATTGG